MRMGIANIQGISTKEVEAFKELGKHTMDIVVLKETKRKEKIKRENKDICIYTVLYCKQREHGVDYLQP